jgi:hypothetical protein
MEPNLAGEWALPEQVVDHLRRLIAQKAFGSRIEPVTSPSVNGPMSSLEREPEEDLDFQGSPSLPNERVVTDGD